MLNTKAPAWLYSITGLCALPLLACAPSAAQATPVETPAGYVTYMSGGWTTASSRVQTSFTFTNPESCSATDGYNVDAADSGHDLFSSMLLSAFMGHVKVTLIIDGCTLNRPHIIGVNLMTQ